MKLKILSLFVIASAFAALAFFAPGAAEDDASSVYRRSWSGTITNAGNDTLSVPVTLSSLWTYNYVLNAAQTSGTTAIIAIVQENNATSGAVWYESGRDTLAGAGTIRVNTADIGTHVLGSRQRVILDGSGTQVSPYTVTATYKKAN